MKNVRIIIVAFSAVVLLSLAVYATKGPCVGGGSESFGPKETVGYGTKTVVSGTIYKDQVCAGSDENDCTETFVPEATRMVTTTATYTGIPDWNTGEVSDWKHQGTETTTDRGKYVC